MSAHDRIKARRRVTRLSQEKVAERLRPYWPGITKGMVSKTENDKRPILFDEGPLWAMALDCDVNELLDPLPDPPEAIMPKQRSKRRRKPRQ